MLSFLQIIDDIFTQLKEEKGVDNFWTESEVKNAANDVYWDIANELECFSGEAIIEIKTGIRTYKIPEDYIFGSLSRVEFDSESIYPVIVSELDTKFGKTWRTATGDPEYYILDLGSIDEISFYPKPDTDGTMYNLASESQDYGVIVAVGDTTYEDFEGEDGIITTTSGEVKFDETEGFGPVLSIEDPGNNIRIFYKKFPKRLSRDTEVFLPPVTYNPKKIITKGSMAILLAKEGEGRDVIKANSYNARYQEALNSLKKPRTKRLHVMQSISNASNRNTGSLLGSHYPSYIR